MSDGLLYLIYVVVKLLAYSAWAYVGLRVLIRKARAIWSAVGFGFVRLSIGIVAGIVIFFSYQPGEENLLVKYIAVYAPVRAVEWSLLALLILGTAGFKSIRWNRALLWILGGILVSFGADFFSPEGIEGHFCVGRCLC